MEADNNLVSYTEEEFYDEFMKPYLKVSFSNFARRTSDEIEELINETNTNDLAAVIVDMGTYGSKSMDLLIKVFADHVILDDTIEINMEIAQALATHFYLQKRGKTGIELYFLSQKEASAGVIFGEYLYEKVPQELDLTEAIAIYVDNILDIFPSRSGAIYKIIETINHEFYHAMERRNKNKTHHYNLDTLQATLDDVIYNSNKNDHIYKNKNYYDCNYSDLVEELNAKQYGATRAISILKKYQTDEFDYIFKRKEKEIKQFETNIRLNTHYKGELVHNRFEVANKLADECIKDDSEILIGYPMLQNIYDANGVRKNLDQLIEEKLTNKRKEFDKIMEIENKLDSENNRKILQKYNDTIENFKNIDRFYAHLIYNEFKTLSSDECDAIFQNKEKTYELEKSINLVLSERYDRVIENNQVYIKKIVPRHVWKRQLVNLKQQVKVAERVKTRLYSYMNNTELNNESKQK